MTGCRFAVTRKTEIHLMTEICWKTHQFYIILNCNRNEIWRYINWNPGLIYHWEGLSLDVHVSPVNNCGSDMAYSYSHYYKHALSWIILARCAKCWQIWVFSMPGAFTGQYRHLLENIGKYRKIEFTILELKTKPYTQHLYMVNFNNRG